MYPHGFSASMSLCSALLKPRFSSACLLSIGILEFCIEHCTEKSKCLGKRTPGGHCIARNMNWFRRSLWLKTKEQRNFHKVLICSPFNIYPVLGVFWVFAQETGCKVKWSLGLFPVPTVISSFEHGRVQVYMGLCNGVIWVPQVMALCSRVVTLSWVNWSQGACWVLLVVAPGNDLAPCLSMAQLSPGTHTSSKRCLCSAGDTWEGDGWPLIMGDVTLGDPGMALFGELELNGIQESRHQLRHCWLGVLI